MEEEYSRAGQCGAYVGAVEEMMCVGSKQHSLQAVELSQWTQAAVQIVLNLPAPSNCFWACRSCGPAEWLALLLTERVMSRPIQVRQL